MRTEKRIIRKFRNKSVLLQLLTFVPFHTVLMIFGMPINESSSALSLAVKKEYSPVTIANHLTTAADLRRAGASVCQKGHMT